jgi:hypothetical protein
MRWMDTHSKTNTWTLHYRLFYGVPIISNYTASELWDGWQMNWMRSGRQRPLPVLHRWWNRRTEENHNADSKTSFPAKIRTRHVPDTSLEYYQAVRSLTDQTDYTHNEVTDTYETDGQTHIHIVFNVWLRQFQWFCSLRAWQEVSRQKPALFYISLTVHLVTILC